MIELSNEKLIKLASEHLRKAAMFLRVTETGNKPYRVGKVINMMAKTTYDDYMILKLFLGEIKYDDVDFETITHAGKLLQVELKDNPHLFQSLATRAEMKYVPPSQRSLKERREYWSRIRGQYLPCLGEHGKEATSAICVLKKRRLIV